MKKVLIGFGCVLLAVCLTIGLTIAFFAIQWEVEKSEINKEIDSMILDQNPTSSVIPSDFKTPREIMEMQFGWLGFTEDEAQEMSNIFETVGITDISNIQAVGNAGIDNLQAFICNIYDSNPDKGGLSLHFTVEKRQLCFISLDGIADTKVDYAYINIFGNVKFKTSNGKKSVTLYDVWDENGEIIPNATGYKAVLDYENKKIEAYK